MNKKKLILSIIIIVATLAIAVVIKNIILAANSNTTTSNIKSLNYGYYELVEGTVSYNNLPGIENGSIDVSTDIKMDKDLPYYAEGSENVTTIRRTWSFEDLSEKKYLFCTNPLLPLPYSAEFGTVYDLEGFTTGTLPQNFRDARNGISGNENNDVAAIRPDDEDTPFIDENRIADPFDNINKDANGKFIGNFYSRIIDYSKLSLKYYTTGNENGFYVDTNGNTYDEVEKAGDISWDLVYIMARAVRDKSDKDGYESKYQLAFWKAYGFAEKNEYRYSNYTMTTEALQIYKEAQAFKAYMDFIEKKQGDNEIGGREPSVKNTNYEYSYNVNEDYYLLGPININYGDLTYIANVKTVNEYGETVSEEKQEIEVGKINDYVLYVKDSSGKESKVDKDDITFVCEGGFNEIEINGKKWNFPKSGKDFYIKVKNGKELYKNKKLEISSFKVSISQFNAEAQVWEIASTDNTTVKYYHWYQGTIVYYTKDGMVKEGPEWSVTSQSAYSRSLRGGAEYGTLEGIYTKNNLPNSLVGSYAYEIHCDECGYDGARTEFPSWGEYNESTFTDNEHYNHDGFSVKIYSKGINSGGSGDGSGGGSGDGSGGGSGGGSGDGSGGGSVEEGTRKKAVLIRDDSKLAHTSEIQGVWAVANARIYWQDYDLTIYFKPTPTTDTPTPTTTTPPPTTDTPSPTPTTTTTPEQQPTYIDIGGNVWVDMPTADKEHHENGIYDGKDYPRQNVLVKLYFKDGTQVKVGTNKLKNGKTVKVVSDSRNNNIKYDGDVYQMYTDVNGRYDFYYLPMDQQYYVEFVYDGMTYEPTTYLAEQNESTYTSNPNGISEECSKVETEINRSEFNENFRIIRGQSNISNGDTQGYTQDATLTKKRALKYWTTRYTTDNKTRLESRLITTDEKNDVVNTKETGKVLVDTTNRSDLLPEDYAISAQTKLYYPFYDKNGSLPIWNVDNKNELEYLQHINLGLKKRTKVDLALQTQIKAGATTIKDKSKVVFYKSSATDKDLKIDATATQDEYIKQEISAADYYWAANYEKIYGDNGNTTGYLIDKDKLNVYVLYRIVLQDQSETQKEYGVVNEIIDYYDNRLEMVPEGEKTKVSELFNVNGFSVPKNAISWVSGTETEVKWNEYTYNGQYQKIVAENLNLKVSNDPTKLTSIYLILKVKNNGDIIYTGTDNSTDGLENIAEISSYSIYNTDGTVAGKVDCDSAPANATPGDKGTYEDDTDPAPMFRLEINWTPRTISGNVWEDLNGNGVIDDSNGIENVTVKLIEYIIKNNNEVVEIERPGLVLNKENKSITVSRSQSIKTDENGGYSFNVEGGNYAIKFIYGNTEMLYGNYANKKYNGQDYQATKYEPFSNIDKNAYSTVEELKNNITNKLVIDELDMRNQVVGVQPDWETNRWGKDDIRNNKSTARDNATIRAKVIESANELTYENANKLYELNTDVIDSKKVSNADVAEILSGNNNKDDKNYTYMEAISDIIVIASNDLVKTEKVMNLGLKERPKASIKLEKKVTRIVLTANDGTVLIDTKDTTKQSNLQKLDNIQTTYMSMDSILMDGATIDIDYKLKVTNDATEDDCLANYVYVDSDKNILEGLGNLNNSLSVKATIFDYVSINLEYRADDNTQTRWEKVYEGDPKPSNVDGIILANGVLEILPRTAKVVSKVLSTSSKELIGEQSEEFNIHLGMTLAENTSNTDLDFIFSNSAEVVKINSQAGRRDYDTIPGNYVPYNEPVEDDCAKTGTTAITPPFGQDGIYYVIAIISAGIIITGIILIKKKVLGK